MSGIEGPGIVGGGGGGGIPTTAAVVTIDDETATLTNSRALTGGTGITLSTATPGQLIINGTAAPGSTVPTTVQGDTLFASTTNVLSALAKNTSATRYLANTGTSNNPAWGQVNLANGVTGTLPAGNQASQAGRLLNCRVITTTSTYTPTAGTGSAIFELSGGGAGGGATNADTSLLDAGAGGGASGSWCRHFVAAISGTYAVTIGAAGAGGLAASGGNGAAGGASACVGSGANLSAPGGLGGKGYNNDAPIVHILYGGAAGAIATGANLVNARGQSGSFGLTTDGVYNVGGFGGSNPFGSGGSALNAGDGDHDGLPGTGFGAAGGGAVISGSPFGGNAGGAGTPGVFIVYEFSA